jgi:hypothetical protein
MRRFVPDRTGIARLLMLPGVREDLQFRAMRVADRVRQTASGVLDGGPEGIVADGYVGRTRVGATVIGVPMHIEVRTRALGSALDAARGP